LTAADPANDVIPIVDVSDTTMAASGTTKKISVNNILGASGTATLASATITGAATVGTTLGVTGVSTFAAGTALLPALTTTGDTNTGIYYPAADTFAVSTGGTERLRVNSSGNVVVGTAVAPVYSSKLRVEGGVEIHTSQALNIQPGNTSPYEIVNRSAGGFAFYPTGSVLGLTLAPSGDVTVSTGNVVMATSGKGIDFSATANSSGTMTSELLNDYEEGTFTPTIVGSTVAGVGTYSGQSGIYTKVGRQVTVQIYLNWSAHTGTGNIRVGNLPFTNTSNFWSASVGYLNNIALTAGSVMTAFVEASASYIVLWQYPTGGGAASEVPIDVAGAIVLSASYTV
jgi:hypothetical protein